MNPEIANIIHRKESESSREREAISVETALAIQRELPFLLAPKRILEHIENGHNELVDPLMERFMDKYAIEWNALDAFCGDTATDRELLTRFVTNTYTPDDLAVLVHYIENHSNEIVFFANESEIDSFLRQFLH